MGRVVSEPVVRDASIDGEALIANLNARGVWEPQAMVLFDICVVDTDAKSYLSHSPVVVLASAEAEKKRKYCNVCTERHATFRFGMQMTLQLVGHCLISTSSLIYSFLKALISVTLLTQPSVV